MALPRRSGFSQSGLCPGPVVDLQHFNLKGRSPNQGHSPNMKTTRSGEAEPSPHIKRRSRKKKGTDYQGQKTNRPRHFAPCPARATFDRTNGKQASEPGSNAQRAQTSAL